MSSLYLTKVVPNSVVLRPPNPLESTIDLTPGPGRAGGYVRRYIAVEKVRSYYSARSEQTKFVTFMFCLPKR